MGERTIKHQLYYYQEGYNHRRRMWMQAKKYDIDEATKQQLTLQSLMDAHKRSE